MPALFSLNAHHLSCISGIMVSHVFSLLIKLSDPVGRVCVITHLAHLWQKEGMKPLESKSSESWPFGLLDLYHLTSLSLFQQ